MYKVFIENRPVYFEKGVQKPSFPLNQFYPKLPLSKYEEFSTTINNMNEVKLPTKFSEPQHDPFFKNFTFIEAAGGLVLHPEKRAYLIIKRLGKYDLPKGKLEKGESPEVGAVREIEEECGIQQPIILKKLICTYHTYHLYGGHFLKKTHWFLLKHEGTDVLSPQLEEDITEAVWIDETNLKPTVFSNTYTSIIEVLNQLEQV